MPVEGASWTLSTGVRVVSSNSGDLQAPVLFPLSRKGVCHASWFGDGCQCSRLTGCHSSLKDREFKCRLKAHHGHNLCLHHASTTGLVLSFRG